MSGDVLAEAVEAAAKALCRYYDGLRPEHEQHISEPDECDYGQAAEVLAAALPVVLAKLEERLAERGTADGKNGQFQMGLLSAASLVRAFAAEVTP